MGSEDSVDDGGHNRAQEAWRVWLARHQGALLLLARQYVATAAEAQDAVQDGFVRFWKVRERAADQTAYLYACVRTAALDLRRSRLARRKREATTAEEGVLAAPAMLDERRALVEAALAQLPEEQREVVVMKIWSELTF